jgi:hypothetical protein
MYSQIGTVISEPLLAILGLGLRNELKLITSSDFTAFDIHMPAI